MKFNYLIIISKHLAISTQLNTKSKAFSIDIGNLFSIARRKNTVQSNFVAAVDRADTRNLLQQNSRKTSIFAT